MGAREQRRDEQGRPLEELTDDDWQEQWELHVMAPMRLMRAMAPVMAERVAAGSSTSARPRGGGRRWQLDAPYSVTKAAQLSLSRVFAEPGPARGCW